MISRPEGWTFVPGVETQTLIAPAGPDAAAIRYTERVRPLRRIGTVIEAWLARHKKLTHTSVGDPEKLVTVEGEWAAFVSVDGAFNGAPAKACLGVVFGDDFYSRIEGYALQKDQHELVYKTVRDLTVNDRHVLGKRRRRYPYASPPDWQPIVRNFTTDWLSPKFPLEHGIIVTYAAGPLEPGIEVDAAAIAARALERGFTIDGDAKETAVRNGQGLDGVLTEMIGKVGEKRMFRAFVTLTDDQYIYPCELMARSEDLWTAHQDAYTSVWKSIDRIPSTTRGKEGTAFDFWVD